MRICVNNMPLHLSRQSNSFCNSIHYENLQTNRIRTVHIKTLPHRTVVQLDLSLYNYIDHQ